MFHKAALTSRHEIKMFVEPAKWEMTTGELGKAGQGDTFRARRLCWGLFASSRSHGWSSSDRRADAAASPCQEASPLLATYYSHFVPPQD